MKTRRLKPETWGHSVILHCDGCGLFVPESKMQPDKSEHIDCIHTGTFHDVAGQDIE